MTNKDIDTLVPPSSSNRQTKGGDRDTREKIHIGSSGYSSRSGGSSITICGLDSKERDQMEGSMHGHHWVTVSDQGRLRAIPTYKDLPDPVDDVMMQPFWRLPTMGVETQLTLFPMDPLPNYSSPSVLVQHLCGYNYTPEGYAREAKKLMQWGFECMRSRRHDSGQYWEVWFLPSLHAAQNELRAAIELAAKGSAISAFCGANCLEAAVSFLCRNASFGTVDAANQRAAMTID